MRGTVLLLAAGGGVRLGCGPKAFVELAGVPLVRRAAEAAAAASAVDRLVVAVPSAEVDRARPLLQGLAKPVRVVPGGDTRQASAAAALDAAGDAGAVAVHDAARALCLPELFDRVLAALDDAPAALVAIPVIDTIKQVTADVVDRTLDRSALVRAQTPQAFRTEVYRRAHSEAARAGFVGTDDVSLVERLGIGVRIVPGDERNLKITSPADLALAEILVSGGDR